MQGNDEDITGLKVQLDNIELRNPLILASGILGTNSHLLLSAHRAGAGAVVTKSIGTSPRDGHDNPTVFELPFGLLNSMGLPNPGIDEFETEMTSLKGSGAIVIGSVFGSNPAEYSVLCTRMEQSGAAAVELNLSCPHAHGLGAEIGSDPSSVAEITAAAASSVKIPVFAKLTPNTSDICALGKAAEKGGAAAVVAINSLKAMAIDPILRKPVMGNKIGGLSGTAIKPIGIRCVFELHEALEIPIIGAGGISSGMDVAEYVMAGANAVEIGTVVKDEGFGVFSRIAAELNDFMKREGFKTVEEMRGIAHE